MENPALMAEVDALMRRGRDALTALRGELLDDLPGIISLAAEMRGRVRVQRRIALMPLTGMVCAALGFLDPGAMLPRWASVVMFMLNAYVFGRWLIPAE